MKQFFDIRCYAEGRHCVKDTERMTPFEQFMGIALVKGSSNEKDDIVDHVGITM